MWFDNSPEEAERWGFNPDRDVVFGPMSTDEMLMGFISCVYSDEDAQAPRPTAATRATETAGGE